MRYVSFLLIDFWSKFFAKFDKNASNMVIIHYLIAHSSQSSYNKNHIFTKIKLLTTNRYNIMKMINNMHLITLVPEKGQPKS